MKTDPAAPTPEAPHPPAADPGDGTRTRPLLLGLLVAGVLLVAVAFRFVTKSDLWLDEALTVNIAKLPLSHLTDALKRDGAPPLYYVLLHGWIQVFGSSDVAVRALSGVLGVAMLPLAWLAGRRVAGADPSRQRWVAWGAVLIVASSPFAIRYSTETRMYMLAMVLVLLGYLAMWRAVDRPSLGPLAGIALVTAALLYTQYWAFFLVGVVGVSQLWLAWRRTGDARRTAVRIVLAIAVGGLLFVPWLPTFAYQMKHTGTPWDTPASPPTNAALGIIDFAGGRMVEGWTIVLPLVVLALLALFGRRRDRWQIDVDLRTFPGVRWEWLVGVLTLVGGLSLSFLTGSGFQSRYASVMYPLFALAVAFGIVVIGDRRVRYGLLGFIVVIGFVGGARNVVTNRTQASEVTDRITAAAKPGDVVGYCPDQLGPDVSRLLPASLPVKQYTFPRFTSPKFVDWVDYADRNAKASPDAYARGLLSRARGHTIWMVYSTGYKTLEGKCEAILNSLTASRGQNQNLVQPNDDIYEFMGLTRYDP
ncbi:MAG TPA: glycosyltransferase family 39 protein [Acidimicrobiia bacterium]